MFALYEKKHQKLVALPVFIRRVVICVGSAFLLVLISLFVGILGYHHLAGFNWIDSLLNASMILGGMGPVGALPNDAAKVFASFYALFSGLVLIAVMGIIFSPIIHRMLHHFHVDEEDMQE